MSTTTGGVLAFTGELHHNAFLPVGGSEMHAVLVLSSRWDELPARGPQGGPGEVLILDASGSMDRDGKREAAIEAGAAAIGRLRDGVAFAVIAGNHQARVLWPEGPRLRCADDASRADAIRALSRLPARGGTAIGRWLTLARDLLHGHPDPLRHVTLISDGRNEHEHADALDAAVRGCAGGLRCDSLGVGTDFDPDELYNVAEKLDGTVRMITDPAALAEVVATITSATMAKAADVQLEVLTTSQSAVRFVKQVQPMIADLDPVPGPGEGPQRYRLGAWGATGPGEEHVYHLCFATDPAAAGAHTVRRTMPGGERVLAERLVARLSLSVPEAAANGLTLTQRYGQAGTDGAPTEKRTGQILAFWTDDPVAPLDPDPMVATVTDRVGLAEELRAGLLAWRRGDVAEANEILGEVRVRAAQVGDTALRERLDDVYDSSSGTFALDAREQVELFEESTVTTVLD